MKNNRFLGLVIVIALLAIAILCEFEVGIPLVNAFLDVALTVAVFWISFKDTQKKSISQQAQIQELQSQIQELQNQIQELQNQISQQEEDRTNPQQNTLWQYAIKK